MDVAGGGHAEATGQLRAEIADDVAEEVAGYDHVELGWVADEFHRESVDIEVTGVDGLVFVANLLEDALPQVMGKSHGVGFVAHADAF